MSLAGIESGVGGDAFDAQRVFADTFSRGLHGAARAGGGFQHQDACRFFGECLGDFARE